MARILVIGDPHIKAKEVEAGNLMMSDIITEAVKLKPDAIVVLGDTLHNHERIHSNPLSRSIAFLGSLSDVAPLYLLIGNHDLRNNQVFLEEHPEHPFTALKRWKNTIVVDTPISFEINGLFFGAIPYVPPGRMKEAMDIMYSTLNITRPVTAIFAHQELRCAKIGAGYSSVGDIWSPDQPLCISGHIHEAHNPAKNVIYLGTPMQQNFGESEDKAIGLFTWNSLSDVSDKSVPASQVPLYLRISLPNVPIRREYKISADDLDILDDILKEIKSGIFLVKIVITGTPEELKIINGCDTVKVLKKINGLIFLNNPISTLEKQENNDYQENYKPDKNSFDELIRSSISDKNILDLYQQLFGRTD